MTAVIGMALGKREIPDELVLDSNTAADMFFKSADKVSYHHPTLLVITYSGIKSRGTH